MSTLAKLLEKIACKQLLAHLEGNDLLYANGDQTI